MLAVNITTSLATDEERAGDVRACAEKWWAVADSTLETFADELLVVASNIVVGVFGINGWSRDASQHQKVCFKLVAAPHWDWLIGQESPVTWRRGQANPVRKVGGVIVGVLRDRQPYRIDGSHGWALDVAPDGSSVTVRGPGPVIVVTGLHNGTAQLSVQDRDRSQKTGGEPSRPAGDRQLKP